MTVFCSMVHAAAARLLHCCVSTEMVCCQLSELACSGNLRADEQMRLIYLVVTGSLQAPGSLGLALGNLEDATLMRIM